MSSSGEQGHPHAEPRSDITEQAMRIYAIRDLLLEKGILTQQGIDSIIAAVEKQSPATGARIVSRAWVDEPFKRRLLDNADDALAELGISSAGPVGFKLVAVENTRDVRHLVVCTLCSCYPRTILGRPPDWYKSAAYRSRAVVEPRAVLAEFGTHLDDGVEVVVHDSTADVRYLVVPERPPGSDHLDEDALAELVHRDCLIGVADPYTAAPA
jgi:nitrile hydratase